MNAPVRILLSLLLLSSLAACSGRSDDGSGDDTAGGQDVKVDFFVDEDVIDGEDLLPDSELPDIIEDQEPGLDTLEDQIETDGLQDQLGDIPWEDLEDTTDAGDSSEDGGGDVIDPPPDPELEVTQCISLPDTGGENCMIEEGSDVLVLRGIVLAPWEVFEGGEILISSGGDIGCVGCDCSSHPEYAAATKITCPKGIVSPGLINAHDHITYNGNYPGDWGTERFEHRHDWRCGIRGHTEQDYDKDDQQTQVIWAELRHVLGGATSIAGAGSAPGFLRNLDRSNWLEGLDTGAADNNTFPLGDSGCTLRSEGCDYPNIDGTWVLDNTCYLPHVAEGIDKETRNEFLCLAYEDDGGVDLTEDNSAYIHVVGLKAVDVAHMAAEGTATIWSPRTNISLYGHTAQVTLMDNLGVRIGMGSDWTLSGSINMLRELNCAAYLNDNHFGGHFTDHELWLMATTWNAQALHMDAAFGSLEVGLVGDVTLFQGDGGNDWFRQIFDADPSKVSLVMRGGVPLYGDVDLVGALSGGGAGCEELPAPACLVGKAVCIEAETGETYASLLPTNAANYPLAYCGVPEGEVTCVPFRQNEFDGAITDDDLDGDGVANDVDNCPEIFNPVRPLDEGAQADHDQDGVGDVCDPCPLQADTEDCEPPDPDDKDADTVANADDNCPNDYNPEQVDTDQDGKGDACDLCAEIANPGDAPCPATIYDAKTGLMPPGSKVSLGGVVTAVASPRFWIQVPEDQQDPVLGARFSGIYVYIPSSNPSNIAIPAEGDVVEFTANVKDWMGQIELDWVEDLQVTASGAPLPTPVVVEPAAVATGGVDAAAYEGVLVSVVQQPVTALNAEDGEYVLADSLIVDDFIWLTEPFPMVDDLLSITGPLMWTYDDSKLEPRGPQDVAAELGLVTFGPSPIYALGGDGPTTTSPVAALSVVAPVGGITMDFTSTNQDAYVDGVVVIPEGQTSVELDMTTPWTPAAPETVTVSLSYDDKTLSIDVIVLPPDYVPAPVSFEPAAITAVVGEATTVQVVLDAPVLNGNDQVLLEVVGDAVASVPAALTVPQGALSATFEVTGLLLGSAELQASTVAASITATLEVIDVPTVGLIITELLYDVPSGDTGYEWVEIFNGTVDEIDLSGYSLGWGGTSYAEGATLSGTLAPGTCAVIGGALSDDTNANPVYDLVLDFDPDLQNSGTAADGLALFAVPWDQVTDTTVPVDAVIYGTENSNELWDESGGPGVVDVGDAAGGSSVSRLGDGTWAVTPDPTPNDCSHALSL